MQMDHYAYTNANRRCTDMPLFLCVDAVERLRPSGRICTACLQEDIPFSDLAEAMLIIHGLCDALSAPQAEFQLRSFPSRHISGQAVPAMIERLAAERDRHGRPVRHTGIRHGAVHTFTVTVLYRQHASIQGQVTDNTAKLKPTLFFRSALELVHILSERLATVDPETG